MVAINVNYRKTSKMVSHLKQVSSITPLKTSMTIENPLFWRCMDPIENGIFQPVILVFKGYYYTKEFMAPIHGPLDMKTRPVSLRPRETI